MFLSSLFDFRNSQDNEVFSLFEKEVLPYIDLDNSLRHLDGSDTHVNNAGAWWSYIVKAYKTKEVFVLT